jgi:predicted branched-subunit amino acid permease
MQHATAHDLRGSQRVNDRGLFRDGFLAMLPLWTGAIPFGIVFATAARDLGLHPLEIQAMSLLVFSAAAQISVVALMGAGASALEIIAATIALNVQLVLFGAVISRQIPLTWVTRLPVAWLLTDATFAVAAARGRMLLPVLLGVGASMYLGWNLGTALGLALGQVIPDPRRLAIDFVVPLAFLAVLVPLLRSRPAILVALVGGGLAVLLGRIIPGGAALIGAGVAASLAGVYWTRADRGSVEQGGGDA